MKILIVDDNDDNRTLLETILRNSGYEVVSAGNGVEALEKLRKDSIDMIVSDILMPVMDGFQFCRECKKDDSLMRIPFVFYTATYTDVKDEEFALSLGAEKFVIKPLEPDEFLDKLKTVIEDHKNALPVTPKTSIEDEEVYLAEYNKRLVKKLEKKMSDLVKEMDIRRQEERRLSAQYFVTQVLVESVTIKEASPKILQAVCMALEWDLGEIWVYDRQDCVLKCSEIWHIPSIEVSEFKKITRQITFPKGIGLPGRVFSNAKPVWVADAAHDTIFLRASVADKEGLHGAFGFPILSGSEVLGTICFFSREIRQPDEDLLNMLSAIGVQIGLFIKRKQAEEDIIKAQKFESLGILAGGIAHDFNNFLAVILGNINLAKMLLKPEDEIFENLTTAEKASRQAEGLARQLNSFSKGGAPVKKTVSISEIIRESVNLALSGSVIRSEFCLPEDTWLIDADMGQMSQVISNLIINAEQAMPKGGIIKAGAENINVTAKDSLPLSDGKYVKVTIKDQGTGIAQEHLQKIFDPYYTTKEKGSGLGLATTYSIIKKHNGHITVESEIGVGTTFHIYLPSAVGGIKNEGRRMKDEGRGTRDEGRGMNGDKRWIWEEG